MSFLQIQNEGHCGNLYACESVDDFPMNFGFLAKGNDSLEPALFEQIDQLHKDMEMQIISKVEFSHQIVLLKEQIAINFMQLEQVKNTLAEADVPIQSSSTTEKNSQP